MYNSILKTWTDLLGNITNINYQDGSEGNYLLSNLIATINNNLPKILTTATIIAFLVIIVWAIAKFFKTIIKV